MGDEGTEHSPLALSKTQIGVEGGAKCGAPDASPSKESRENDPDLARLIELWPKLPDEIKAAINALIQSHR